MKKYLWTLILLIVGGAVAGSLWFLSANAENEMMAKEKSERIKLPEPSIVSNTPIEKALLERRSVRNYKKEPLSLKEVAQLLWAAQGVTDRRGFRTAPSAGALYPLEVYVVVGNVTGLDDGIYHYQPNEHALVKVADGDRRIELSKASLGQGWVRDGAVSIVFSAVYERVTSRYGERGVRYTLMEVGHAVENVHLQAVSLGLGTVVVGAFYDSGVKKTMNLKGQEEPLCIMPVGKL